jgi:hypothetical protein
MYQRDDCIAQASICRENAQTDPACYDYWIDQGCRVASTRHPGQTRESSDL